MALLYQGSGGIYRGYFVVRQGAWNSALLFLPARLPRTSNGDVTSVHVRTITTIVPKGSAAVALYEIATVLRKQNGSKQSSSVVRIKDSDQCKHKNEDHSMRHAKEHKYSTSGFLHYKVKSCVPDPGAAAKRDLYFGKRNTSP
ncbi:hypothetical protein V6N13_026100 [Hibiscus sabdariffa]|uniref:Uncharacterized protein n=2 Tax=Hibiscus sabdariffa TaxID=183260 RepID=A0ABR2AQE7_9ROSI